MHISLQFGEFLDPEAGTCWTGLSPAALEDMGLFFSSHNLVHKEMPSLLLSLREKKGR